MANEIANTNAAQTHVIAKSLTTGDARAMILQTIMDLRNGSMPTDRGMAIAANMKVLNDSMTAEINAAKMAYSTRNEAHNFGQVVQMGQRAIG